MSPSTICPVSGSRGIWPDRKSIGPAWTACEYGPIALGAAADDTARRIGGQKCAVVVQAEACADGAARCAQVMHTVAQGIASSRYLPSIHLQAYMRERYGFATVCGNARIEGIAVGIITNNGPLDVPGAVTVTLGLLALVFGLTHAAEQRPLGV